MDGSFQSCVDFHCSRFDLIKANKAQTKRPSKWGNAQFPKSIRPLWSVPSDDGWKKSCSTSRSIDIVINNFNIGFIICSQHRVIFYVIQPEISSITCRVESSDNCDRVIAQNLWKRWETCMQNQVKTGSSNQNHETIVWRHRAKGESSQDALGSSSDVSYVIQILSQFTTINHLRSPPITFDIV